MYSRFARYIAISYNIVTEIHIEKFAEFKCSTRPSSSNIRIRSFDILTGPKYLRGSVTYVILSAINIEKYVPLIVIRANTSEFKLVCEKVDKKGLFTAR